MIEDLARYECGMFEDVEETSRQSIEAEEITTIGLLETMISEEEFAQAGGYEISYTVFDLQYRRMTRKSWQSGSKPRRVRAGFRRNQGILREAMDELAG
jgi:hypothetical protein